MSRGAILPFKISEEIKLSQKLISVLTNLYSKGDNKEITKFSQELEKLRKILDFSTIQRQVHQDFRLAVEFEPLMIKYYTMLMKLEFLLSKCLHGKEIKTGISFKWNNSFNLKSNMIGIEDIEYEIVSFLYNLSMIYYFQGIYFISFPSKPEKLKGITKLRNFLWAITQIVSRITQIEAQKPFDLDLNILKSYSYYSKGLIFCTLTELLKETSENIQFKLSGMWMKSGSLFENSLNVLKNLDSGFSTLKLFKIFFTNISFNLVLSKANAFGIITHILGERAKEDSTKGYMGNSVFYTTIVKNDLEQFTSKSEQALQLTKEQRDYCIKEFKAITKTLDERTKLNDRLYVDKEVGYPNLSEFYEEIQTDIVDLEPLHIKQNLLDIENIVFARDVWDILSSKMKTRIEYYSYELNREVEKFDLIKETIYKRYGIEEVLSGKYKNFRDPEIPKELREQINLFNEKGGLDSLSGQSSIIIHLRASVEKILDETDKSLMEESIEYNVLAEKYGEAWDLKSSAIVNQHLVNQLKDLRGRLEFASKNDEKNLKGIENMKTWMILFQSDIKEILQKFTPGDLQKSQHIIGRIADNITILSDLIASSSEEIRKAILRFDQMEERNIIPNVILSYNVSDDLESLITKLIRTQSEDFDKVFDMICKHTKLLNKMTVESHKLKSQLEKLEDKTVETNWMKILGNIDTIRENFKAGENFYKQLHFNSKELLNEVKRYCQARKEEKLKAEGIIKYLDDLKNNKNKQPLFS